MDFNSPIQQPESQENIKSLKLDLEKTDKENLLVGYKTNGMKYSVRDHRLRYFYPDEYMKFFDALKNDQQRLTSDFLINTGARINEARHVKVADIDWERKNIMLRKTKVRAKKGERNPKPRTISVSSQFIGRLKKYVRDKSNDEYIGILSTPAFNICLKKALQTAKIHDWYMFSAHNFRKTHGNWLKALGIDIGEICNRLGHDYNTYLKDYASSDIFSFKDKQDMRLILGNLYAR